MLDCNVAIIGGGPAGSTLGSLLKKYDPSLKVAIFEREQFPREHVGESQLPPISEVLDEMGAWEKIEAANFPIKIGATYRWGTSKDLWDFEFLAGQKFVDQPRPGKYEGQRRRTAFQVDRAIYDEILLNHAASMGCHVQQQCRVQKVVADGDFIEGLVLGDGTEVSADYFIDASGGSAILRRAVGVDITAPTALKNIAIWDYWTNAEWAVKIGVGGTRVQVLSIGFGWLWFIPMGPERTSLGLIVPAEYYRTCGLTPEQLYLKAIEEDPLVSQLTRNASREGILRTTKDWSFIADRMHGENWFLVGESAGFADPILAAGMTLAHVGAHDLACTLLALKNGTHKETWLKEQYTEVQRTRLWQHIRFADYWYSSNAHFTELQDFTSEIAREAGITLDSKTAWQWLGAGGFISNDSLEPGFGGYDVETIKRMHRYIAGGEFTWKILQYNEFKLDLSGSQRREQALYYRGQVHRIASFKKEGRTLPLVGIYAPLVEILQRETKFHKIIGAMQVVSERQPITGSAQQDRRWAFQALEALIDAGWVQASVDPSSPMLSAEFPLENDHVHLNQDNVKVASNA